ncbi:G2/mitotic-specific cyclin-B2-like isoform X1 [Daphnia pulex]|uniref:G2/mitotic-specific cyclin-B2-like isoform X1 n=1 Tax=Daphnia pulex TaxID=6669 RepID=UPI001EDCCE08|nr:G2/mitotic-specific cyclin-B2-like isoform X1 [Daphnia pulex]
MSNNRVPLKEISDTLRRSHRLNGVSKQLNTSTSSMPPQTKAPLNQKNVKVISSKKPSQRRRHKVTAGANFSNAANCKRQTVVRRTKSDCVVIDIDDAPPSTSSVTVPPLVGVKPEDLWLCQPSVAHDMYLHAKSLESRHCFSPNYLSTVGSRVSNEMRATLVNWLVEIHGHLKLEPETLHTAVRLLDATLQHFKVGVNRLQLCGLAVFWLATKLESRALSAQDLLYLMCYKGDVLILVRMEQTVLKLLNFQLQVADPIFFLNRLMLYDENGQSEEFYNTCNYCMDSVLHDITTVDIPASELASAALLAGRMIDGHLEWPYPIGYATEHWPSPKKLEPLAQKMIRAILEASEGKSTYTGAYKKYASRKRFYGLSESQKFSSVNLSKLIEVRPSSIC